MTRSRIACWSVGVLVFGLAVGCGRAPEPDAGEEGPKSRRHYFGIQPPPRTFDGDQPPVQVTPQAAAAIRKVLADTGDSDYYLRLSVTPGGCTGFTNKLDLDPEVTADDVVFESEGVKIAVARKQLELARGTLVDHVEEKGQVGFKITNSKREADAANKPCPVPDADDEGQD